MVASNPSGIGSTKELHPDDKTWLTERRLESPLCRVALIEPLIPENSGNISRTCVATGSELHFVEPLGFELTESRIKRAGLDYWVHLAAARHRSFEHFAKFVGAKSQRVFFVETFGKRTLWDCEFERGDWLVFGKETTGLTREQVSMFPAGEDRVFRLPMPGETRSLNLSNAVAVCVYELLRQVQVQPQSLDPTN